MYIRQYIVCLQSDRMTLEDFLATAKDKKGRSCMNVIDADSRHRNPRPFSLPKCAQDVSLAHMFFPEDMPHGLDPKDGVSDYILLGEKHSITDFHVDFSGTCVFYMVISGEKEFFIILPSPNNIELFRQWTEWTEQSRGHR